MDESETNGLEGVRCSKGRNRGGMMTGRDGKQLENYRPEYFPVGKYATSPILIMESDRKKVPGGGAPRPDRTTRTEEGLLTRSSSTRADDGPRPDCAGGETLKRKSTAKHKIRIGTWNIRTIKNGAKEAMVSECESYGIDILGIVGWQGKDIFV